MEKILKVSAGELLNLFDQFKLDINVDEFMTTAETFGYVEVDLESSAQRFAKLYLAYRRSMKHRGIKLMKPRDNQWKTLVEVTTEAISFCTENDLEESTGFRLFLDVAGQVTNSMKLHEIRAKSDKIHEHFVAVEILTTDPNKKTTQKIWDGMVSKYLASTGREYPVRYVPLQVQYFVEAAALCREYKMKPEDFVGMVVNEFAWLGFPKPYHLVGEKVLELMKRGHDAKYGATKVKRVSLLHVTNQRPDRDD